MTQQTLTTDTGTIVSLWRYHQRTNHQISLDMVENVSEAPSVSSAQLVQIPVNIFQFGIGYSWIP